MRVTVRIQCLVFGVVGFAGSGFQKGRDSGLGFETEFTV